MKNKILVILFLLLGLFILPKETINAQVTLIPCNNDNIPCPTDTPVPTLDPCIRTKTCPTPTPTPSPTSVPPTSVPPTAIPATATPIPPTPTKKPVFAPTTVVEEIVDEEETPTPSPTEKPHPTATPTPVVQVQSAFVRAVPTIEEISFKPDVLIKSFLLGLLLLLLILFPAEVFNATLQSNYDEISGWLHPKWIAGLHLNKIGERLNKLPSFVSVLIFAAFGALLNSQVSPGFKFDKANLSLVVGVFLTIIIITVFYDLVRAYYLKKRFGIKSKLRIHTLGLGTALFMVIVSRVTNFLPGYMYGIFTGLIYSASLRDEDEGEGLAAATWILIGLAFVGWFILIPVKEAASVDDPSFMVLTMQAMLASLWTSTLTLLVFGMIPIKYLYGEQVKKWNRKGWMLIYVIGIMLFVHTLLDPEQSFYGKSDKVSLISIIALFVSFAAISFTFWGYFRYRHLWQRRA